MDKIILKEKRSCTQNHLYRTYALPHFSNAAVAGLLACNEHTLVAGHSLVHFGKSGTLMLLLPTAGSITYTDTASRAHHLTAGQIVAISFEVDTTYVLKNSSAADLLNVFEIVIQSTHKAAAGHGVLKKFDIDASKNNLVDVAFFKNAPEPFHFAIGKFEGRQEATFATIQKHKTVFCMVLHGAFEVHNRLLETRDALLLHNVHHVEMEALSNDAILFLLAISED